MRLILLTFIVAVSASVSAFAGHLDIAVIQFPEEKTQDQLEQAFAGQSLSDITDADRTVTKVSYLKGGYVLFAQSMPMAPGSSSATTTRLQNQRANVQSQLGHGNVSVDIELVEGIRAGLRSLQTRHYGGAGQLPVGVTRVLNLKRLQGKTSNVVKNRIETSNYDTTTVLLVQYVP